MKKILIVNQGQTQNYGDIAINTTISKFLKEKGIDVDFMPYWEETKIFGKNYKNIPNIIIRNIMKINMIVDFLNEISIKKQIKGKKYDAVIIGGGELIGNHVGFNSSLYVLTKIFKKKNVPIYLLAVSGDTDISKKMKRRYKKAISRCKEVIARDNHTSQICENVYNTKCINGVDVVFAYLKIIDRKYYEEQVVKKNLAVIVPISFNNKIKETLKLDNKKEYYKYIMQLVNQNNNNFDKLVVTSTVLDDGKAAKELYEYLKENLHKNEIEYADYSSLLDFIKLLKESKIVISARMHAMILGLIYGNDIEVIPFKKKLQVFKNEYQDKHNIKEAQELAYNELEKLFEEIIK